MSADTDLMPIPGPVDPVPVPRAASPRADGRIDLVGLSKDEIRVAFEAAGPRAQAGQASRQAAVALDLQSRGHEFRRHERRCQGAARLVCRSFRDFAPRGSGGAGLFRRHAQMAAHDARWPRIRNGVHPRCRSRDTMRFEPGRVHTQLPFLPYRHDGAGPKPRAGGDRRPGDAGSRCAGRMAQSQPGKAAC